MLLGTSLPFCDLLQLAASVLEPSLCPYFFVRPDSCLGNICCLRILCFSVANLMEHFFSFSAAMKLKEKKSRPKPTNCGRFQKKGIKVVGKWKEVKIDPNMFADGQMDDLVCFEELTDYQLVSPAKSSSSLFSKEEPKKRKAQAVAEGEEEGEPGSSKKKMKLKKSKDVETEGTSSQKVFEVKDTEPVPQGEGTICPDPEVGEMASESPAQTVLKKKKKKGKKKSEPSQGTSPKMPKKAKTWMPEMHDHKADVSAWKDLFVPKPVLRALSFLGFSAPTPIQALTLAPAIRDKLDILGAAETGKGILIWPG